MKNQGNLQSIYEFTQSKQEMSAFKTESFKRSKSKSRLSSIKAKQYYLTDTQPSSSDHTKSSSEINLAKLEYECQLRKLEKQNEELKQTIIKYRKYDFYQLDEQKIKTFILQNQMCKRKIVQLQLDLANNHQNIKQLQKHITQLQIENEYLDRSSKIVREKLQTMLKINIKQKKQKELIICCQFCSYCNENYQQNHNNKTQRNQLKNNDRKKSYLNEVKVSEIYQNPFINKKYQQKLIKLKNQDGKNIPNPKKTLRSIKSGQKNRSISKSSYKIQSSSNKKVSKILVFENSIEKDAKNYLKSVKSLQNLKQMMQKQKRTQYNSKNNNSSQQESQQKDKYYKYQENYYQKGYVQKKLSKNLQQKKKSAYFN